MVCECTWLHIWTCLWCGSGCHSVYKPSVHNLVSYSSGKQLCLITVWQLWITCSSRPTSQDHYSGTSLIHLRQEFRLLLIPALPGDQRQQEKDWKRKKIMLNETNQIKNYLYLISIICFCKMSYFAFFIFPYRCGWTSTWGHFLDGKCRKLFKSKKG